jgi:subtilisin family serine protease
VRRFCFSRRATVCLLLGLLSIPAWAQFRTEIFNGQEAVAQEVLVKFRDTMPAGMSAVLQAEDIERWQAVGGAGALLLHSRGKDVPTLVRDLQARAEIEYAEPNYVVYAVVIPDDPRFGDLWGLQNNGTPGADIGAVLAWDFTTGSAANVVTIVDTGVDYNHPDLAGNIWSAPADFTVSIGDRDITCSAGTHGFNAINNTCDPMDDNNHGTHVSGTVGAVGNNGVGVAGVNWTASIMGAKFLSSGGSGTTANAINAMEFALQAKAIFSDTGEANVRILSNSWGGGGSSQALLDEILRANDNGVLFVAAAGNNNRNIDANPFYPASYDSPNILAIASTTRTDARSGFSNYGPNTVHLGAPGSSIVSTIRNNRYGSMSGTSMAAPHVSGAAALVLSACDLDTASLKQLLLDSVDPIPSMSGRTITGGRLNVYNALAACAPANTETKE